jgi:hypothetical protein
MKLEKCPTLPDTGCAENRESFQEFLTEGLRLTGMSLRDAAKEFKTAPGTISRWVNGHSAPALIAREAIIKILSSRIKRMGVPIKERQARSFSAMKGAK